MPSGVMPGMAPAVALGSQGSVPGAAQHTVHGTRRGAPQWSAGGGLAAIPGEHAVGRVYEFRAAEAQPPWAAHAHGAQPQLQGAHAHAPTTSPLPTQLAGKEEAPRYCGLKAAAHGTGPGRREPPAHAHFP